MSHGHLPLPEAQRLAGRLMDALGPVCDRIAVAGSIRRQMTTVGDVELVAIPKRANGIDFLALHLDAWVVEGKISRTVPPGITNRPAWGARYKKFWCWTNDRWGWVQVDLFLATPLNWGAIYTIRTGPAEFSQALVTRFKYQTPYRQQDGNLIEQATGAIVPVPTEEEYFRLAGLAYLPLEQRTTETLRRVRR